MFRLFKCTRAVVSIELALLVPVMFALTAGAVDFVLLTYTAYQVNNAASTAASIVSQMPVTGNYTAANITEVMASVDSASSPLNVAGPITPVGTGSGGVIVTIVTQAATGPVNPQTAYQCVVTALTTLPVSHVGTPTSSAVSAALPPPAPGFSPITMDSSDAAVVGEAFYAYQPFIFGGGFFGLRVFNLYDVAIYRFRGNPSSLPTGGANGSHLLKVTGQNASTGVVTTSGSC
jgi:Flp pilus assembly protein TadG